MARPRLFSRITVLAWPAVVLLLAVVSVSLPSQGLADSGSRAAAQGTATVPVTPVLLGTPDPRFIIEGTVAAISGTTITINTPDGKLRSIEVPADVPVTRNNQPSSLDAIEATERITIQRDGQQKVIGIITYTVPPTPVPSPATTATVRATGTPAVAVTGTATAQATPDGEIVTGTITGVEGGQLTVSGDDGQEYQFDTRNAPGLEVTRNGAQSTAAQLRVGDGVIVTLGADGKPARIEATATDAEPGAGIDWRYVVYPLLLLAPFLLLLLMFGGARVPFIVRRRTE